MPYTKSMSDDTPIAPPEKTERRTVGPLAAVIIVVLILALGGFYIFVTQIERIRAQHASAQVNS